MNDPDLNTMANELRRINWIEPLTFEEIEACELAAGRVYDQSTKSGVAQAKRRLVHPLPGWDNWAVRIYLGGGQRTIGIVDSKHIADAMRFADMALMHFWKYKLRGAAPPNKFTINLDMDRLEGDMQNEENALDLLRREEAHLLSIGVIKTSEERGRDEKERKRAMRKGFMRATMVTNHVETMDRMGGLFEEVEKSTAQIAVLRDRHAEVMARIDRLDRSLTSVLTALLNKPVYTPSPTWTPGQTYPGPYNPGVTPGFGWPLPPQITCTTATEPNT